MNQVQDICHSFPRQGAGVELPPNFPVASDQILLLSSWFQSSSHSPGSPSSHQGHQRLSGSSWLNWISKLCQRVLYSPFYFRILPRCFAKVISLLHTRTIFFCHVPCHVPLKGHNLMHCSASPSSPSLGCVWGSVAPSHSGVLGNIPPQKGSSHQELKMKKTTI